MKNESVISLVDTFVVIDTETTGLDFYFSNILEIAAVKYENGRPVGTFSSLCRPVSYIYEPFIQENKPHYVPEYITKLTGITDEMIETAPQLTEVLPSFLEFIGEELLVGQNTSFDVRHIQAACEECSLPPIENSYMNIMRIAKKVYPGHSRYRLSNIAELCGIPQDKAHRALDDCRITAACYLHMKEQILSTMSEYKFLSLFHKTRVSYRQFIHSLPFENITADEDGVFYGKTVVFTGELEKLTRKDALALVGKLGGIPADSITKSTNYLVVGNYEFIASVKDGKTRKIKKAEDLAAKGLDIAVISENTFYEMVNMR